MKHAKSSKPTRLYKVVPYAVLSLSALILVTFLAIADRVAQREAKAELENDIVQIQGKISSRIEQQIALLRGAAGVFAVNPKASRQDFRDYAESLGLKLFYPGTQSLGYSQRVRSADIVAWESTARGDDGKPMHVWPGAGTPRESVYPITYVEPHNATNQNGLGYDMMTNPVRRSAMEKARDLGEPTLSSQYEYLRPDKKGNRQYGFAVFVPIYKGGHIPAPPYREALLSGFINSPFLPADIFGDLFKDSSMNLNISLYEGGVDKPFFTKRFTQGSNPGEPLSSDFEVAHHQWSLRVSRTADVESNVLGYLPYAGGTVCLVLFLLALAQVRERDRTEKVLTELARAEKGQRTLAEAGVLLSESLDYKQTLRGVAALVVPDFADWATVDILGPDDTISRLAVEHVDPNRKSLAYSIQERWPAKLSDPGGLARVLRTGQPEFAPKVTDEMLVAAALDADQLGVFREVGLTSGIIVPVTNRGRTHGALTLAFAESGRQYTKADLELAVEIGLRAGLAIENALNAQAAFDELEERKRAEDKVRRMNESLELIVEDRTRELAAANKELEAFCYSVSHDLRAPLRSVDGFTKAILDDYGDVLDFQAKEYLLRVRSAAKRMDELITALLVLSRITRADMKREAVDITKLASETVDEMFQGLAKKPEVIIATGLSAVADSDMARLVLDNLIGNAFKFSSRSAEAKVEVGLMKSKGVDAFFVRDNGAGFNPAYANKLFIAFERLHSHSEYPGSGIGLATVQRIVQKHGGDVWAESEEGKGATFFFTLG
jgi:signal transduction histidine kinase/CHASE1-domain containing sensor protein